MPEVKEISLEAGLVTIKVNGSASFTFNPTDARFIRRIYTAFNNLGEKQAEVDKKNTREMDAAEIFDYLDARDKEMREIIDSVFGENFSDSVFGQMDSFAYVDGMPMWANFLFLVIDEIEVQSAKEKQRSDERMAVYTAKYRRNK